MSILPTMLYAIGNSGEKIPPTRSASGTCPMCQETLIPKCGAIVTHHWSHKGRIDCDSWHEPETEWHRRWKSLVRKDNCEVTIKKNGKTHRADIRTQNNVVVELQHSSISVAEIHAREQFYGAGMVWLFDATQVNSKRARLYFGRPKPWHYDYIREHLEFGAKVPDNLRWFRWIQPRTTAFSTKQGKTYRTADGTLILEEPTDKRSDIRTW